MSYELAIIGAGNMAEAIVRGVLARGVLQPGQVIAADVSVERRELFQSQLQVKAVTENIDAARDARIVLLSVKPQQMAEALGGLSLVMSPDALVLSIAAGITTKYIETHLGGTTAWHVVRSMPNTPMLVGEGMVALSPGQHATAGDVAAARRLFEAAARVIDVPEAKLDAVTALSGSGPAYFFYLVEHLIAAGVSLGLSEAEAHLLATQTAAGAAKMLTSSTDSPRELRRKVTSPKGTTQAAIETLDEHATPAAVAAALHAAARRSKELAM